MNILRGFGLLKPTHADRPAQRRPLSASQKTAAQDIASRYATDSMNQHDRASMHRALRDAGIPPSRELRDILQRAGVARRPHQHEHDHASPDSAVGRIANRALDPEPPAPGFVVDFRQKHARGETTPADFGALADTLRAHAKSLRGNLIDAVA